MSFAGYIPYTDYVWGVLMVKKFFMLVWSCVVVLDLWCVDFYAWDFNSCEIKDILFMVSEDAGISITADDTVSGKGNLKFAGKDFNVAFDSFLEENRLFVKKTAEKWIVSRFRFEVVDGLYSVDACDLLPVQILEKLSLSLDEVVNYDQLPPVKLSLHYKNVSKQELLEGIAARLGNYQVKLSDRQITFLKSTDQKKIQQTDGYVKINCSPDSGVFIDLKNTSFFEVLEELFAYCENPVSYCLLTEKNSGIIRESFFSEDIESSIRKLASLNGYSCIEKEKIYYFTKAEKVLDEFLFGSKNWIKIDVKNITSAKAAHLINQRFGKIDYLELPGTHSFLCKGTESELLEIESFVKEIDVKAESFCIVPKYLNSTEYLKLIPPEFEKSQFYVSAENGPVYFNGSEEEYQLLIEKMKNRDVPAVSIRYDLLILQYDESEQNNWATSLNVNRISLGDRNNIGAQIGSVMSLNLNVVSAFGLTMAANIQASIEENNTRVFADTVLHGVSGKNISFQNTSTYRYRDNNLDPETGKPIYSGVTREISSGIKLDICGWVSGEGLITSTVTASVSRQGTDTSSLTGNPPPTTEKIVTTEVCGKNGEPIILSGLIQNSSNEEKYGKPIVSKIPLVGKVFDNSRKTKEKSQMVIFLVPHINSKTDNTDIFLTQEWADERLNHLKNQVVNNEAI